MFGRFFVYPLFLLSFWFLLLLSKNPKIPKIFSLFIFVCFFVSLLWFALKKSKKILLCLVCFVFVWFFFVCLFLKNRKHQKYLFFFFGFVSSLQGSAVLSGFWFHVNYSSHTSEGQ